MSDPELLYRGMRVAPDSLPLVDRSASALGVRPGIDIPVLDGRVRPNTGGMSVTADHLMAMPDHRLPKVFGGTSVHPVFRLAYTDLSPNLVARCDRPAKSPYHRVVEPAVECSFDEYEGLLARTRVHWIILI